MSTERVSCEREGIRFVWDGGSTVLLYRKARATALYQLLDHELRIDGPDNLVPDQQTFAEFIDDWIATGELDALNLRLASAQP